MITDTVFVGIYVKENAVSEPYELLLRLENIIEVSDTYLTFRVCDTDKSYDTLLLAEPLGTVIKKLLAAGAGISR